MDVQCFSRAATLVVLILSFLIAECEIVSFTFIEKSQCQKLDHTLLGVKRLSDQDKQIMVDIHNKFRDKIASSAETRGKEGGQPGAENMQEMVWDDNVANFATKLAYKCLDDHEIHHYKGDQMGQNLATGSSYKRNINEAFTESIERLMTLWYDEVDLYKYGDQYSGGTGHYTQVVWANSSRVGCGVSFFIKGSFRTVWVVCDYYPGGNIVPLSADEPMNPYVSGSRDCGKHNLKDSKKYSHLCSYSTQNCGSFILLIVIIAILPIIF